MNAEIRAVGSPILAAVLSVGIAGSALAGTPVSESPDMAASPAVSEELELLKEEETVSIASRYEQPISEAPSNVYVITDEDIRQSGATDLPTVLRRIPGIEVMQTTGADFNVSVRGDNQLDANKILVMVDGRSIYVDVQAQVLWKAIPVTLPEIKRIEVLKGPASAVYGFNAFDGIINIITKSPEEMRGTTLQFGGGEFGTISSAAVHAGTHGKLGYRLSVGHDQNQQWRDRDALAYRSNKFNIQTEYALSSESKLLASGGVVDVNRFDGPIFEDVVSPNNPVKLGYASVAYERPDFFIRGFWNRYDVSALLQFNPLLAPFLRITDRNGNPNPSLLADTYNLESQHTVRIAKSNRLTYGVNYRYNTVSNNFNAGYGHENRLGFYVQDEWRTTETITAIAGVRYDLDTFIQPTISPRTAILFQPIRDHTFHIGISVAYRPPTINEKTQDGRVALLPPLPPAVTSVQGGMELSPEQIISYEIGYQGWFLKHRLRARADLFFNHISDLISTRDQSPVLALSANDGGNADIYGGEAGLEFLATKWLSGFANYSYQEIGQSFTGRVRRGAPHYKFNVGLRGEWDNGLNGEVTYHYYGATTYPIGQSFETFSALGLVQPPNPLVGSYNLLNMRVGYRFWQQKAAAGYMRDAEVAISVFNALNDEHKEHPLGDTIGRRVMGWITMKF